MWLGSGLQVCDAGWVGIGGKTIFSETLWPKASPLFCAKTKPFKKVCRMYWIFQALGLEQTTAAECWPYKHDKHTLIIFVHIPSSWAQSTSFLESIWFWSRSQVKLAIVNTVFRSSSFFLRRLLFTHFVGTQEAVFLWPYFDPTRRNMQSGQHLV